jgi:hypothetical protein
MISPRQLTNDLLIVAITDTGGKHLRPRCGGMSRCLLHRENAAINS